MICKLTGVIDEIKPTELILSVRDVGYLLTIPLSTYENIVGLDSITLHVYTLHKEDQLKLFGFYTEQEKNLFSVLINISGIGPAMAISLLSGLTIERLIEAVQTDNTGLLVKIPGIGKSKAEKVIFELKRKFKKIQEFAKTSTGTSSILNDAVEALVSLGFDDALSGDTVSYILKEHEDETLENVVKEALKVLSS